MKSFNQTDFGVVFVKENPMFHHFTVYRIKFLHIRGLVTGTVIY